MCADGPTSNLATDIAESFNQGAKTPGVSV